MYTIQPFEPTEQNYETYVDIHNTIYPDSAITVKGRRYDDRRRNPQFIEVRDLILKDGKTIGYGEFGEAFWFGSDGNYWMHICVHPDHRRQGAAAHWYEHALATIEARNGQQIMAETIETFTDAIQFMHNRGFEKIMVNARSRIVFSEVDLDALPDPTAALAADGIEIVTLSQLKQRYDDWMARALDVANAISADVPRTEVFRPIPLRDFKSWLNHPFCNPDGWFYAIDSKLAGDEVIGLSTQSLDPDNPQRIHVGMTGVRRLYRRRGIARAMKLAALRFAKAAGGHFCDTDNEENNPMYTLNRQLGFKPMPSNIEFKKIL